MIEKYLPKTKSERAYHLGEECAEVIALLCKAGRFGIRNHHPLDSHKRSNAELLLYEIQDLEYAIKSIKPDLLVEIKGRCPTKTFKILKERHG